MIDFTKETLDWLRDGKIPDCGKRTGYSVKREAYFIKARAEAVKRAERFKEIGDGSGAAESSDIAQFFEDALKSLKKTHRTAVWLCDARRPNTAYCSRCGEPAFTDLKYGLYLFPHCPWCGVKMEEDEHGNVVSEYEKKECGNDRQA